MNALIDKNTLQYIIDCKGVELKYIAEKTQVEEPRLRLFTDNDSNILPTIKQAKKIALCLRVPFAALYMNAKDIPTTDLPKVKNLRTLNGAPLEDNSALNLAMIDLLQERDFLLNDDESIGFNYATFAPKAPNSTDPKIWATFIRNYFSLKMEEQYSFKSKRQFFLYLKGKIEQKGVLVNGFRGVPVENTRGFAIYKNKLPIIGVNDEDRYPAKSFTTIHEVVHLLKHESTICNDTYNFSPMQGEEVFCNAVAGELLVPKSELKCLLKTSMLKTPFTDKDIESISKLFSVSKEVIIRRLLDIKVIDKYTYNQFQNQFQRELVEEREHRKLNKAYKFRKNIARDSFDNTSFYVSTVLIRGLQNEVYSKKEVADHLGIPQNHIENFYKEALKWSK